MPDWNWKPKDSKHPGLLYEPGNWGDILKGAWMLAAMRWMMKNFGADACSLVDPFAGTPVYPLTPGTKDRMKKAGGLAMAGAVRPFVDRNEWPSTGMLAASLMGHPVHVFDADPERRQALSGRSEFKLLPGEDGWTIAADYEHSATGLLLIDPYDFLGEWKERTGLLAEAAQHTSILIYAYNRAARGPAPLRDYRAFRTSLDEVLNGRRKLIGRAPADAVLPSAYHEMIFLPGGDTTGHRQLNTLLDELEEITRALDGVIRSDGVTER